MRPPLTRGCIGQGDVPERPSASDQPQACSLERLPDHGFDNDETYYVAGQRGRQRQRGDAVEVVEASPVSVQDMWQYYKANGGAAEIGFDSRAAAQPDAAAWRCCCSSSAPAPCCGDARRFGRCCARWPWERR